MPLNRQGVRMPIPAVQRLRPLALGWLLSFGVFGLFAALLGAQVVLGAGHSVSDAVLFAGRDWLPWAVLAPLLFLLVERLPWDRGRRARALLAYVVAGAIALALAGAWAGFIDPQPDRPGPPPLPGERAEVAEAPPEFIEAEDEPQPPRPPKGPPPMRSVIFGAPIYLAILGLAHARLFSRRAKERELKAAALREDMARANLLALRMQIRPHFLFNALNAIASLIHEAPDKADEMTVALAGFLRLTLEAPDEHEIPLRRELEFTDLYLRIEQIRFGERLRLVHEISSGAAGALVPAFLLQPLLENAVRHGLAPLSRTTTVTLVARREGERLLLRVADDGEGATEGRPVREGVGLANTRARLAHLYGDAASLSLRHDAGFVVEISIPFRVAP